jgi:hypothetical protein
MAPHATESEIGITRYENEGKLEPPHRHKQAFELQYMTVGLTAYLDLTTAYRIRLSLPDFQIANDKRPTSIIFIFTGRSSKHFRMTRPKADESRDYRWRIAMKKRNWARIARQLSMEKPFGLTRQLA